MIPFTDRKPLQNQSFGKTSSKQVLARVSRSDVKSDVDFDEIMRKCGERLKTDENYKKSDYDLDFIRYKILKKAPEKESPIQMCDENQFTFNDNDFDDSFSTTSGSQFNFATPESRTSFFTSNW